MSSAPVELLPPRARKQYLQVVAFDDAAILELAQGTVLRLTQGLRSKRIICVSISESQTGSSIGTTPRIAKQQERARTLREYHS